MSIDGATRRFLQRLPPKAKSGLWFVGLWAAGVLCFAAAVLPLRAAMSLLF